MLPVCRAVDLASRPVDRRRLIKDLWGHRAKGNSALLAIEHRTAAFTSARGWS